MYEAKGGAPKNEPTHYDHRILPLIRRELGSAGVSHREDTSASAQVPGSGRGMFLHWTGWPPLQATEAKHFEASRPKQPRLLAAGNCPTCAIPHFLVCPVLRFCVFLPSREMIYSWR